MIEHDLTGRQEYSSGTLWHEGRGLGPQFLVLVLVLVPRTSLAGLPSRVTSLPYAEYKTKSEQLHSRRLLYFVITYKLLN